MAHSDLPLPGHNHISLTHYMEKIAFAKKGYTHEIVGKDHVRKLFLDLF